MSESKEIAIFLLTNKSMYISKRRNHDGIVRYCLYRKHCPLKWVSKRAMDKLKPVLRVGYLFTHRNGQLGYVLDIKKIRSFRKNNWFKKKYRQIRLLK